MAKRTTLLLLASLFVSSCANDDDFQPVPPVVTPTSTLSTIDITLGVDNIVALPASVDDRIEVVFDRYTAITAPNGQRVHFLSQIGVSDDLLLRTRGILRQYLRDQAGTALGADKSATFNRMASRGSTFVLHTDAASYDAMDADVAAFQALFGDRLGSLDSTTIVQEGSAAYLQASPAIDPSFAVLSRFLLTQGLSAGQPAFQTALTAAKDNAVAMNLYRPDAMLPLAEVDDEYLALALTVYYGVWAHDPNLDGTSGAASEYDFDDRAAIQAGDPGMFALIEDFFPATHRYSAFLDATFNGTFEMEFDGLTTYTNRSQYLERCGMRGASTGRINGNALDNIFLGNDVGTDFEGRGGNDGIEAGSGTDRAFFSGNIADYTITPLGSNVTRIEDMTMNRDGIDDVRGVVEAVFLDGTVTL